MMNKFKLVIGIIIWLSAILCGYSGFLLVVPYYHSWGQQEMLGQTKEAWLKQRMMEWGYLFHPVNIQIIFDEEVDIRPGSKLYRLKNNQRVEIGVVYAKGDEPTTYKYVVYARLYPESAPYLQPKTRFALVREPMNAAWIIATLLPTQKRAKIKHQFSNYLHAHVGEIKVLLTPIVSELAQDSYQIFKKNFPRTIDAHKTEFLRTISKFKKSYVDRELSPLLEKVVWPILLKRCRKKLQPVLKDIWKKFPKFSLVMLWLYQSLPGTDNNHAQKRMEKYLQKELPPLLKKHRQTLAKIFIQAFKDMSKDKQMTKALKKAILCFFKDEEVLAWLKVVILELYKKNEKEIVTKFKEKWNSPKFKKEFRKLGNSFEPYLAKIINSIVLKSDNKTISSELAKVLRRQVFLKDRYCFYVYDLATKPSTLSPKRFPGIINE